MRLAEAVAGRVIGVGEGLAGAGLSRSQAVERIIFVDNLDNLGSGLRSRGRWWNGQPFAGNGQQRGLQAGQESLEEIGQGLQPAPRVEGGLGGGCLAFRQRGGVGVERRAGLRQDTFRGQSALGCTLALGRGDPRTSALTGC